MHFRTDYIRTDVLFNVVLLFKASQVIKFKWSRHYHYCTDGFVHGVITVRTCCYERKRVAWLAYFGGDLISYVNHSDTAKYMPAILQ